MKKIVVIGSGESGTGAAILAKKQGYTVFVSDKGIIKDAYKKMLQEHHIKFEEGVHTESSILDADEVIKSPGISDKIEIIKLLKEKGIPIISEIEFAGRYTQAKIIGITGTNGKTTTTSLIYHIFKKAGYNVRLAGNIGRSFALEIALNETDCDYYVLELSSFQLDGTENFRVHTAVLLNITPDHLDRYDYNMQNYIDAKFRITLAQQASDYFIYWAEDPILQEEVKKRNIKARCLPFGIEKKEGVYAYIENQQLIINLDNEITDMFLDEIGIQGKHNQQNAMAAGLSSRVNDIRKTTIKEALCDFENVEHRLEYIARVKGIDFINDSKATNVNSVWYALETMTNPVIWIAGGIDKGNDYTDLIELARTKVKALICLGVDNTKLKEAFSGVVPQILETQSMHEAVKAGYYLGKKGDVVLLSPACASFDLFENYEDRGQQFRQFVREL